MTGPDADALAAAVVEIERHAARTGWDQPPRLFALVETGALLAREPQLADQVGDGALTPVEQEGLSRERALEDQLPTMTWPDTVQGCAAVVERLVLPADAESDLPDDAAEAARYAAAHPGRDEVRIVAGALRTGASYCAVRVRGHDDDDEVMTGADLAPALVELVRSTLEPEDR